MSHYLLPILALAFFSIQPAHAQTDTPATNTPVTSETALSENVAVGTLIGLEGTVSVASADGQITPLTDRAPIHMNDVIETGPGSRALIVLIDNTEMTLGENAQLTIDEYIFAEDNEAVNKARYSVLRGAFLYTSGLVAKKEVPDVSINTPYANIGIRGTSFWGGEIDGAYGVLVTDGQVSVQSDRGRINVGKGAGTFLTARNAIPAHAEAWGQNKIDRAVATITMKDAKNLRTRIAQNAETQKAQRQLYKSYLTKKFENRKLQRGTRTPATRIENLPPPVRTPEKRGDLKPDGTQKQAAPLRQIQKLNEKTKDAAKDAEKDKGANAASPPAGAPRINLPSMPAPERHDRRTHPAQGKKSGAAGAL